MNETRDDRSPTPTPLEADPNSPLETDVATPLDAPEQIGPYRIIGVLGKGGMGVVYLAQQTYPVRRRVALKLVKLGMDTEEVTVRFESERQALALMDHPGIAQVYDGGATPTGRPYFVMELVPGLPITEYCDRHRLPIDQRLRLFGQVCQAVQHAHQKGIIHRDLKPSNILVTTPGGVPLPKVIDFGIAKATRAPLTDDAVHTEHGQTMGTPEYMSPEQADASTVDVDTRSDIYSLGMILYELLTGVLPTEPGVLRRVRLDEIGRRIREEARPRPSLRARSLGESANRIARRRSTTIRGLSRRLVGDLDWIVMKCIENEPGGRYGTAAELTDDVERHLANEAVRAGPPGVTYQLRKLIVRRRGFVLGVSGVLLALVLGLVVSLALYVQVDRALHEKRIEHDRAVRLGREADQQRRVAVSREIASRALAHESSDPERGLLLAMAAVGESPTELAEDALRRLFLRSHVRAVLSGHSDSIERAQFDPRGQRVVTASLDGTVRLWEAGTGRLERILEGHGAGFESAAFSPDGNRIVSTSSDGTGVVWDALTGEETARFGVAPLSLNAAYFTPDGLHIVSEGPRTVDTWKAETGKHLANMAGHTDYVIMVRVSPDGRRVLTASGDATARLWDLETGEEQARLAGHGKDLRSAEFRSDGSEIVTASYDGTARIWTVPEGKLRQTLDVHEGMVSHAIFSPDGSLVATADAEGYVSVFRSRDGQRLARRKGHDEWARRVAFSPDGSRLASVGFEGTARIWEVSPFRTSAILRGHTSYLFEASFSPDGRALLTHGADGTARIWTVPTRRRILEVKAHRMEARRVAFHPEGRIVASGGLDGYVRLWDASSGEMTAEYREQGSPTNDLSMSPDGHRILAVIASGQSRVLDARDLHVVAKLPDDEHEPLCGAWLPDDASLVWGCREGLAQIWTVGSPEPIHRLMGHDGPVWDVAAAPDGRSVLTAGDDGTGRTWAVDSGEPLLILRGHTAPLTGAAWSRDGRIIATSSRDGTARTWDPETGSERHVLRAHFDRVDGIAIHPDGDRIATVSRDSSTRIWDARTGTGLAVLSQDGAPTSGVEFGPLGRNLATSTYGGMVRIYDLEVFAPLDEMLEEARGRVTRELTPSERRIFLHERPAATAPTGTGASPSPDGG